MGVRVYNWIYSYGSLLDNFGLGHLIMGWNSQETMDRVISGIGWFPSDFQNFTNITYEGIIIKPYTFLSVWAYDFGLPALTILFIFLVIVWFKTPKKFLPECIVGIVILLLFPPITSATPWVIFAVFAKKIRDKV